MNSPVVEQTTAYWAEFAEQGVAITAMAASTAAILAETTELAGVATVALPEIATATTASAATALTIEGTAGSILAELEAGIKVQVTDWPQRYDVDIKSCSTTLPVRVEDRVKVEQTDLFSAKIDEISVAVAAIEATEAAAAATLVEIGASADALVATSATTAASTTAGAASTAAVLAKLTSGVDVVVTSMPTATADPNLLASVNAIKISTLNMQQDVRDLDENGVKVKAQDPAVVNDLAAIVDSQSSILHYVGEMASGVVIQNTPLEVTVAGDVAVKPVAGQSFPVVNPTSTGQILPLYSAILGPQFESIPLPNVTYVGHDANILSKVSNVYPGATNDRGALLTKTE